MRKSRWRKRLLFKRVALRPRIVTLGLMLDRAQRDQSASPGAVFATTHWSVVLTAGQGEEKARDAALEKLCRTYWYPLYAYARRKGSGPDDAKDLTQQFFLRLLQGNRLALAHPSRGKFRTFLLSSFQNFLVNEWTKTSREKRGGGQEFLPLQSEDPENLYAFEPVDARTPESVYEERWAATVMNQALTQLSGEYAGGREKLFKMLQGCAWGEKADQPLAGVASMLGMSEGAVRVAVHRLRGRYRELLRQTIAQTVSSENEVDDELRHLIQIVSRRAM